MELHILRNMNFRMSLPSCVKSSFKDVIMLDSTAVTVTLLVPLTVKTARVTYKVERVSRANLDVLIYNVIQHVLKEGMV